MSEIKKIRNNQKTDLAKKLIVMILIILLLLFLMVSCSKRENRKIDKPIIQGQLEFMTKGKEIQVIEVGTSYEELGAVAFFNNEDISSNVNIDLSGVDTTKIGTYKVIYTVTIDGVTKTIERTVIVKDSVKPVIKLNGSGAITLTQGEIYIEPGFTATDNYDGDITNKVIITSNVDVTRLGEYVIVYKVTDSSINTSYIKRIVKVLGYETTNKLENEQMDKTPEEIEEGDLKETIITYPNLELFDNSTVYIEYPNEYIELGYKSTDEIDGDITKNVVITGTVDNSMLGLYNLKYSITNSSGKTTELTRTVIVRDTTPPVISILEVFINLEQGTDYNPLSNIIVTDNYPDILDVTYTSVPHFNSNKSGIYQITYNAKDLSGNISTESATIMIKDVTLPIINIENTDMTIVEGENINLLDGITAIDNIDGDITNKITYICEPVFNKDIPGTYVITYKVKDNAGNETIKQKTITVIEDSTAPTGIVNYSITNLTNQDVVVILTTNKEIITPAGWTKLDNTNYTKTYTENTIENFTIKDKYSNTGSVNVSITNIDKVAPFINITTETVSILVGNNIDLLDSVTAIDDVDGDITNKITYIDTPEFNKDIVGTYIITYNVKDTAGNHAVSKTKTVIVSDIIIPIGNVTYNPNTITNGNVTATMTTNKEIMTPYGWDKIDSTTYQKVYVQNTTETLTITDFDHMTGTVNIAITNIDKEKPIITVENTNITIKQGQDIDLLENVTATDNVDGSLTTSMIYNSVPTFNKDVAGTYVITYSVTDSAGNTDTSIKTITVEELNSPVININDIDNIYEMEVFSTIPSNFSATAVDDLGNTLIVTVNALSINSNIVGVYKIIFTATDIFGHTSTETRDFKVVDTTKPVIILNGTNPMYLEAKVDLYIESGAVVTDNYDNSVQSKLIITGTVNPNVIGEYIVTYEVTDNYGNNETTTRTVIVQDTKAPVVTVNPTVITVAKGSSWNTKTGVTALDIYDGDVTENITYTGTLDLNLEGEYNLTYTVEDNQGNISEGVLRKVIVTLTEPPLITLDSTNVYIAEVFTEKPEIKATAVDYEGSTITDILIDSTAINMNLIGIYPVVITATDTNGVTATLTINVEVKHTTKPVITLTGEDSVTLEVLTDTYIEPGYVGISNYYGDITSGVTVTGTINTSQLGTYTVVYSLTDSSGNIAENKTRTINVVDTTKPTITLIGDDPHIVDLGSVYSDPGVMAIDNYDTDIQTKVIMNTDELDIGTIGTYKIYYNVTDASGNIADQVLRTVIVKDISGPVINILESIKEIQAGEEYDLLSNITVTDNSNGNIQVSHTTDPTPFNTGTNNTYTVIYTAIDESGNTSIAACAVVIKDLVPPVINLQNDNISINQGEIIDLLDGVTAYDNIDGDLTQEITFTSSPNFDSALPSVYLITYSVSDSSGNLATAVKTITVIEDLTVLEATLTYSPEILTNGSVVVTMTVNKEIITPEGWTLVNIDEQTGAYIYEKEYMENIVEIITIKDILNKTAQVEISIANIDKEPPVIIIENTNVTINQGEGIDLLDGVTAYDNVDGDLTSQIIYITNPYFDNNIAGSYLITYVVTDSTGNISDLKTKTITVKPQVGPIITVNDEVNKYSMEVHKIMPVSFSATAVDEYGRSLIVTVDTSNINANKLGTYQIIFTATDYLGRTATVTRDFLVEDTTAPEIILNGQDTIFLEAKVDKYIEKGATVVDNYDNEVQKSLVITGNVNPDVLATYTVTYTATDSSRKHRNKY